MNRGRLTYSQKNYSGCRHSDHVAALNAFQAWERARDRGGESGEAAFCDQRGINMATARTTADTKNQLKDLLVSQGFPEECMERQGYDFHGCDDNLDTMIGILSMGLYPNVCMHKEKRKVLTTEAKAALIHKSSVNCSKDAIEFPVPFFVFGEKIRTRAVSCKQTTMVSPLHLILFGARRVELLSDGKVRIDNWINLDMDPHQAALVCALRPAIERVVFRASESPDAIGDIDQHTDSTVAVVRELCKVNAGRHEMASLEANRGRNNISSSSSGVGEKRSSRPWYGDESDGSPSKRGAFDGARGGFRGGRGRGVFGMQY